MSEVDLLVLIGGLAQIGLLLFCMSLMRDK